MSYSVQYIYIVNATYGLLASLAGFLMQHLAKDELKIYTPLGTTLNSLTLEKGGFSGMEDFFTVNVVVDLTQHGAVYLLLCLLVKTAVYLFAFKYIVIPEEYYSYNSIKALSSCPQGIFHEELIANQLMEVFHVTNTINNKNPVINKMTKIVHIMTTQPLYPYHLVSPDSSITQFPHFCSKHLKSLTPPMNIPLLI